MTSATDLNTAEQRYAVVDATHVVFGSAGDPTRREAGFVAYVGALLGGLYAFPLIRALVVTADQGSTAQWIRSPGMAIAALIATAALLLGALEAGRVRGPVVPQLPWLTHVVRTDLDRWLVLRGSFLLSLGGVLYAGLLGGGIIGASIFGAGAASVAAIPIGLIAGLIVGVLAFVMWLLGQSRLGSTVSRSLVGSAGAPWVTAVRSLGAHDLQIQAARSDRIVAGAYAGDLRVIRLESARPVHRGRSLRLRPSGPMLGYVRRDLIGLRRAPMQFLGGIALTCAGSAGIAATYASDVVPPLLAVVAAAVSYLGCGAFAEGLRLEADTMGTPVLFGGSPLRAALAHLVVPGGLSLVVAVATGAAVSVAVGAPIAVVLGWGLLTWLATIGGQLCAAYRGQYRPSGWTVKPTPQAIMAFYAWPFVVVAVHGGAVAYAVARFGPSPVLAVGGVLVALALLAGGVSRVRTVALEHRKV